MIETPAEVPEELVPTDDLYISLGGGKEVALRCYRAQLHGCPERPAIGLDRAYSARPLVLVEKQAMFPELAVLSFFRKKGWEGAWVDASHRKYFDRMPNQSKGISLGAHAAQVLARVAQYAGSGRAGCWDLVLWADRAVAFAAVVGADDSPGAAATTAAAGRLLGEARTGWLGAAVKSGMSVAQFAVVRWEYRKVAARKKRA
ncbi:MAG TPA: hypothetical protein VMF68_11340 [Spirochaetia bacterium]|nr:hypothetical protein [Spirochaetia bacterium]